MLKIFGQPEKWKQNFFLPNYLPLIRQWPWKSIGTIQWYITASEVFTRFVTAAHTVTVNEHESLPLTSLLYWNKIKSAICFVLISEGVDRGVGLSSSRPLTSSPPPPLCLPPPFSEQIFLFFPPSFFAQFFSPLPLPLLPPPQLPSLAPSSPTSLLPCLPSS